MNAARHSHNFLSVTKEGKSAIFNTSGNMDCHIIHRGGNNKVNYTSEDVKESSKILVDNGMLPNIILMRVMRTVTKTISYKGMLLRT